MLDSMAIRKYREWASQIAAVYVLGLIFIFPIYSTNKYFNILEDRFSCFWKWTAAAVFSMLVIFFISLIMHVREKHDEYKKAFPELKKIPDAVWHSFTRTDRLLILFLITATIAVCLSEWPREAFWGTDGRLQGLSLWIWYAAAYFIISRHYVPEWWHLEAFLLSGCLLAIWGISDYAGADIFGWMSKVKEEQRAMFTSSFGNINTYTQVMSVYFAACCGTAIYSNKAKILALHICEMLIFLTALITGQSDNAVIGVITVFAVLYFVAVRDLKTFKNYTMLWLFTFFAFGFASVLTVVSSSPMAGFDKGILLALSEHNLIFFMIVIPFVVLFMSIDKFYKLASDKFYELPAYPDWDYYMEEGWRRRFRSVRFGHIVTFINIGICAFVLLVLLCTDFGKGGTIEAISLGPLEKFVTFNDSWGTYRGFAWRITIENFSQLPFIQKLFGTGLETFGLLTRQNNYEEMLNVCGQIFDSPHNEALQFLITTGILGTACFYGFAGSCIYKGIKNKRTPVVMMAVTYIAVSLVSISVPIAMPYCIAALSICGGRNPPKAPQDMQEVNNP